MNVLCVLARVPAPGTGKSRLRRGLGDAVTDRLAAAFIADVLGWSPGLADAVLVAHSGAASLLPTSQRPRLLVPQAEAGDLGDRISAAVDAAFAHGAERAVIVGTDCPTLPGELLDAAFAGLSLAPSTLVPADDGGWIALGVDRPLDRSLATVAWSSADAGRQTIDALAADGRPPLVLDPWYDIDEPADLDRVRRDPALATRAPHTCAVVTGMAAALG